MKETFMFYGSGDPSTGLQPVRGKIIVQDNTINPTGVWKEFLKEGLSNFYGEPVAVFTLGEWKAALEEEEKFLREFGDTLSHYY